MQAICDSNLFKKNYPSSRFPSIFFRKTAILVYARNYEKKTQLRRTLERVDAMGSDKVCYPLPADEKRERGRERERESEMKTQDGHSHKAKSKHVHVLCAA